MIIMITKFSALEMRKSLFFWFAYVSERSASSKKPPAEDD
jgi:hypothetical protein